MQSDVQQGVGPYSHKSCTATCAAAEKFGQAAVEHQRALVKSTALQCLEKRGWIFLQKIPSESINHQRDIPKVTCANPSCPTFDQAFRANEFRISVEPSSKMHLKYVPHLPLADLAATCASPLLGEANIRGKGEKQCLWMHVICAETMDLLQTKDIDRVQMERRVCTVPGLNYQLDSLQRYSILKWLAVIQGEKTLIRIEGRDFWRKDDGLAVYLSKQQYDHVGRWKNGRIDISAKDVRHQPMSAVLAYTQELKERVSRLEVESNSTIRLPQATTAKHRAVVFERKAREGFRESEMKMKSLNEVQEGDSGYEADVDDFECPLAARASPRHGLLPFEAPKKVKKGVTIRHLKRPNRNLWDEYLIKIRSAALRATEPNVDVDEALEALMVNFGPSEEEKSSSESLRLDTPMVRFLLSDVEDASGHLDPLAQETPLENVQEDLLEDDNTSTEDAQSLDSWSDPDKTIATIHRNVGLAERLF